MIRKTNKHKRKMEVGIMKMKKAIALLMAVGMVATLLAGCGSTDSSDADSSGTDVGSESDSSEEEKTLSVTVWDYTSSPQFQLIIEAYEAANPNVTIEVINNSADDYNDAVAVTLTAAQADPDVVWLKNTDELIDLSSKNQLLDLNTYIEADEFDLDLYKGAAEELQIDGATYALPFRLDWFVLYYNKDIFDDAGIDYPTSELTWDEYYSLAEQLTSGEGSSKIYGTHNHTWPLLVTNWACQYGEYTVIEEDYDFLTDWYNLALDLQENGYAQSYANLSTGNIHYSSVFENEQCAMLPMGTWFIATLMQAEADAEIDFNWGVTSIPVEEGADTGYVIGSTTPVAVSAYTDEPELSWDFVQFATSEEAALLLATEGVFTAVQSDELTEVLTSSEYFPEDEESKAALQYDSFIIDRVIDPDINTVYAIHEEIYEMIMVGEYTLEEGLAELEERVAEIKGW